MVTLRWGPLSKSFVSGLHAVLQAVAHAEEQLGTPHQEGETHDSPQSQMDVSCMSLLSAACSHPCARCLPGLLCARGLHTFLGLSGRLQMPSASKAACVLSASCLYLIQVALYMFPQQLGVLQETASASTKQSRGDRSGKVS